MNTFLAMGVTTISDSRLYLLPLSHLIFSLALPILVFYAILGVWVFRTVRGALHEPSERQTPSQGHGNGSSETLKSDGNHSGGPSPDLLLRGFTPAPV